MYTSCFKFQLTSSNGVTCSEAAYIHTHRYIHSDWIKTETLLFYYWIFFLYYHWCMSFFCIVRKWNRRFSMNVHKSMGRNRFFKRAHTLSFKTIIFKMKNYSNCTLIHSLFRLWYHIYKRQTQNLVINLCKNEIKTSTTPSCSEPIPAQNLRKNSVLRTVFSHLKPTMDFYYVHRFSWVKVQCVQIKAPVFKPRLWTIGLIFFQNSKSM